MWICNFSLFTTFYTSWICIVNIVVRMWERQKVLTGLWPDDGKISSWSNKLDLIVNKEKLCLQSKTQDLTQLTFFGLDSRSPWKEIKTDQDEWRLGKVFHRKWKSEKFRFDQRNGRQLLQHTERRSKNCSRHFRWKKLLI